MDISRRIKTIRLTSGLTVKKKMKNPLSALWAGIFGLALLTSGTTQAYELSGNRWPDGSNIIFEINVPTPDYPAVPGRDAGLIDGQPSLAASIMRALAYTNAQMKNVKVSGVGAAPDATAPRSGDGKNSIYVSKTRAFTNTLYANGYHDNVILDLVVKDGNVIEADIVLNGNTNWDSFPGFSTSAERYVNGQRITTNDVYRAVSHQLGHILGLNDHAPVDGELSVMVPTPAGQNQYNESPYRFTSDDVKGLYSLYQDPGANSAGGFDYVTRSAKLVNVSTRMGVGTGNDVLIGGFIIARPAGMDEATTWDPKLTPARYSPRPLTVAIRAIGPSMGITGALADTTLEIYNSKGGLIASNDDWADGPSASALVQSGLAPTSPKEAAIQIKLDEGAYTAIVRGKNNTTGIGLVEVYAADNGGAEKTFTDANGTIHQYSIDNGSKLVNISSRGKVLTGDNVMIGGFIVQGLVSKKVMIRAIGPSLGIPGNLMDTTLEVFNANGQLTNNDDYTVGTQVNDITLRAKVYPETAPQPSGFTPGSTQEAAAVAMLAPGPYTVIVRGKANTTGIGLVEVYDLDPEGNLSR